MEPIAADLANARWTRKSILSYLDGEQNLPWILRVIEANGDVESARHFLEDLIGYGHPERREQLIRRLKHDAA